MISLFLHQFEEYRYPGYFPGMFNSVVFKSPQSDRFPLNTNSSLVVNVSGWFLYFLAAILAEDALWLCIATMIVSAGNSVAHAFLFNIKGRTLYNPGMFTSLFLPISGYFFYWIIANNAASNMDWLLGIAIGIVLSGGLMKFIKLTKDERASFIFPKRNMMPGKQG